MSESTSGSTKISIFKLLWRSWARAALVPLVLVEIFGLGIYLATNAYTRDASIDTLREFADRNLHDITVRIADGIDTRLRGITYATNHFRAATADALTNDYLPDEAEKQRYTMSPDGMYYAPEDDGGAAGFYSSLTEVGPAQKERLWKLSQLDPLMRRMVASDPLIVQIYYNGFDALNRIYPWLDGYTILPADIDFTSFAFYYEADAEHNPRRETVWTEPYVDPAGRGWILSVIAPVYRGDFLDGVVGIDVTIDRLIEGVLKLELPWDGYGILVSRSGQILALPPAGGIDLGMPSLTQHDYAQRVSADTFMPQEYSLPVQLPQLSQSIMENQSGHVHTRELNGEPKIAAWSTIGNSGWKLITFVDEAKIYEPARSIGEQFFQLALLMIVAMVLFYAVFFVFLWRRARKMAQRIATPLELFSASAVAIGRGEYKQTLPETGITEFDGSARALANTGQQLETAMQSLLQARLDAEAASTSKSRFLTQMSHELRTPLNAILGFAQLLSMDADKLDEEQIEQIRHIEESGQQLLSMLEGVLLFAEIDPGDIKQGLLPMDLCDSIRSLLKEFAPDFQSRKINLVDEITNTECPLVLAASDELTMALRCVLNNAITYNVDGGEVHLKLASSPMGKTISIRVGSSGHSIDTQFHERIFDAFERGDLHGSIDGAGIGLPIARAMMRAMGGDAFMEASTDGMNWFCLELKLAEPQEMVAGWE